MKFYEEKEVTETARIFLKRVCDLCGRESKDYDWSTGKFSVNETKLSVTAKLTEGHAYPESGLGMDISIDLCPWCFKEKLIPWLKSQGARVEEEEWWF